jgi:DNA-binding NarL/FixJ family response regulator
MSAARLRVLVVDDHRMFAQSLVRILEDEPDLEVIGIATTAADAGAMAARHQPDVVVLDFELPDTQGGCGTGIIREAWPAAKVVMLTGHAEPAVLASAVESGCSGFVTKDRATDELIDAVRSVGSGGAAIPPAMLMQVLSNLREDVSPADAVALTPREQEVLTLLAEGVTTDDIASRLYLSRNTIRNHVQRVLSKLGAHSRLEAVVIASRDGLISPPGGAL